MKRQMGCTVFDLSEQNLTKILIYIYSLGDINCIKALLSEVMQEPNQNQQKILDEVFEQWRNYLEQVDDVCVIGVMI
ncbi:MAG: hypothetical protein K0U33_05485 [Bacteroidetes bacterium]|nr:hypothetical protein [Bacteroidota bacterium]